LSLLRSGATVSNTDEARPKVRLAPAVPWIAVSLEPSDPGFPSYRATLRNSGGRALWQGVGLKATAQGLVTLSLPRSLLAAGDFTVAVEGLPAGSSPVSAGNFPFRVVP
jgi:hypothetical protein